MWEHQILRLYVGGLPYQTTSEDLADLFSQVGQVLSATVITDRDSGRSKGFGFVEMSNDQESRNAIDQLNGSRLGERTIIVNEARERQQSGGGNRYQNRDRRPGPRGRNGYRDERW
jgi:RNA recognition motif-containing protein